MTVENIKTKINGILSGSYSAQVYEPIPFAFCY